MTEPRTIGDVLRAARRKRRVSIERAAEETRVRADFLMRMESDELDFLAPAYVRGFLKSYARFLGLAPEPLVAEFDRRFGTARTDTAQIAALERRTKSVPRQRRRPSSWAVAATLAVCVLIALALYGNSLAPEPDTEPRVAQEDGDSSGSPAEEETPTATPSPSATQKPEKDKIAFTDGIEVEIVAKRAACWVSVDADGASVYTSSPSLAVGQRAGPFTATENMDIVLGNAYGVDLIINGRRLGPLGEEGQVLTIKLPDDAKNLL